MQSKHIKKRLNFEQDVFQVQDNEIKRGDVFQGVRLDGVGSEQQGVRPCIVVSNDKCNKFSPVVTIVPLSSQNKPFLPTHIALSAKTYGLERDSTVLCEQIRTVDKVRLGYKIGRLTLEDMRKINSKLLLQMGL